MGILQYQLDNSIQTKHNARLLYITASTYENDWPSIKHSHYFSELFLVTGGSGALLVENEKFPLSVNDLVIVNPNIEHTEISTGQDPLSYIILGIEGLQFLFPQEKQYYIHNVGNTKSECSNLHFCFNLLLNELTNKGDGYLEICTSALDILMVEIQRLTHTTITSESSSPADKDLAKVKRYIDSHYQENITLESLANMIHLNKFYFSHSFSKFYGISPINYLNNRRIQVCKELLLSSDYKISEIAEIVGFSSESYFSQNFKKNCGLSAREYRKANKPPYSNGKE
ncbi:MAG: AraC family transcriptional regulator [Eubacteriales bacterium]|nr:AraC family transcriptional regulator [Eubacteriales bacterium]